MSKLPVPEFISVNPDRIEREMVARYEEATGKTTTPSQLERLLIKVFAYQQTLTQIAANEAAKQNLIAYSTYPFLDYLAQMFGVSRLDATPARTTLRFEFDEDIAFANAVGIIPAGTLVATPDSKYEFATLKSTTINVTNSFAEIECESTAQTSGANGYVENQAWRLRDPLAYVKTEVMNLQKTFSGSDREIDERLRERIYAAPDSFSTCGTRKAYRYHALTVNSQILDCYVAGNADDTSIPSGTVKVYLLSQPLIDNDAVQAQNLVNAVQEYLSDERIRPLTDTVVVANAEFQNVAATITVKRYIDSDAAKVVSETRASYQQFAAAIKRKMGKDLVASQVIKALSVPGVYDIAIQFSPQPSAIAPTRVVNLNSVTFIDEVVQEVEQ
jgi:phage-related baseplate assembly protein